MSPRYTAPRRALARWLAGAIAVSALVASIVVPVFVQRAEAAAGDVVIQPGQLAVTFVARACPDYPDIMANRARNNIQESLRDLGKDTVYTAGQPINPAIEADNQPNCATPLRGWNFQLGQGYTGKTEASQYLSTVTGGYPPPPITTAGPIPELDQNGVDTGRTIDGAVTVVLTADQAARAQQGQSLWTQGGFGTETLPLPVGRYGFGALRCAVDNLNGDNVEFISYPQSARHVFCYYFAIDIPPPAGTITVVKQLAPGNIGSQVFPFRGNISYDPAPGGETGEFNLTASATSAGRVSFIRGAVIDGALPWTFRELVPPDWEITGTPSCTTTPGIDSPWRYTAAGGFEVTLRADDVVVCTITNTRRLIGPSALYKETVGGVGAFPFVITPPAPAPVVSPTVTTTAPDTPTLVAEPEFSVPGTYTATETLPPVSYGTWELTQVVCDIAGTISSLPITASGQQRTASATITAGQSANCVFTNQFTSRGAIGIAKTTRNGVGTFDYSIVPVDPANPNQYRYQATTQTPGTSVPAAPLTGTPSATNLPIGSQWEVQELLPAANAAGFWRVVSADCGPVPVPRGLDLGTATLTVQITEANPEVQCSFTNQFVSEGSLRVVKTTSASEALRPDAAILTTVCDDEPFPPLSVAPGQEQNTHVLTTSGFVTCSVAETATGAAPGVTVATAATKTVDGVEAPYVLGEEFVVEPEDVVVVRVDNTLTAAPPTPTPTPTPTHPPLPATGSNFDAAPVVWAAVIAMVSGLALVLGARVRRRRS